MSERQFSLFMWSNLLAAADGWSWMVKDMVQKEIKMRYSTIHNNLTPLINLIQKELTKDSPEHVEDFLSSAEVFSKCLERIKNAKTVEEKQQLFRIMEAWGNNEIEVKNDENKAD